MTYCLGLLLEDGLVMIADTRTNAGVDNISTFRKMHIWERPDDRVMVLLTAGNLAITQSVVALLSEAVDAGDGRESLTTAPSMFRCAELVGEAVRAVWNRDGPAMEQHAGGFNASFLLGGQIVGRRCRLFEIYQAGNFIEATADTPYLQIGEHKYGKPILDRAARFETPLIDGLKLGLVSMDSTLRSNLSVGLPIDIALYRRDALNLALRKRVGEDDPYFSALRQRWSDALRQAYQAIPSPDWA
ncbi:proteasome-type protease [Inquilinus sp. OTU3971]|uniref:proteasome-type protease n=1 Tax=Inquilinus sp. OTU3971 TaxID=3043855 RepID=UPI00313BBB1F